MSPRLGALLVAAALAGGCAVPSWVPFLGRKDKPRPEAKAAPTAPTAPEPTKPVAEEPPKPGEILSRPFAAGDDVTDRVVAVVNNDAITLGELQEGVAVYFHENRQAAASTNPEELARKILYQLIDQRVQLQEADREKITAEDAEVVEEMNDRIKRLGLKSIGELERAAKEQGVSMDAVRKRVRDNIRVSKIIRRKVALRVSVTEQEVDQYFKENREKLETGLSYHARHILVTPEGPDGDAAWEAARIKAELLRTQLLSGADLAELAREQSRDPGSAKDGGDLGTLKRGELAPETEAEILRLKPGEISKPYRSPLGYHLFRLESKEELEGDGLLRARQQIRDILFRQKYETRLEAWLKEIKHRAVIEVRM